MAVLNGSHYGQIEGVGGVLPCVMNREQRRRGSLGQAGTGLCGPRGYGGSGGIGIGTIGFGHGRIQVRQRSRDIRQPPRRDGRVQPGMPDIVIVVPPGSIVLILLPKVLVLTLVLVILVLRFRRTQHQMLCRQSLGGLGIGGGDAVDQHDKARRRHGARLAGAQGGVMRVGIPLDQHGGGHPRHGRDKRPGHGQIGDNLRRGGRGRGKQEKRKKAGQHGRLARRYVILYQPPP